MTVLHYHALSLTELNLQPLSRAFSRAFSLSLSLSLSLFLSLKRHSNAA